MQDLFSLDDFSVSLHVSDRDYSEKSFLLDNLDILINSVLHLYIYGSIPDCCFK